MSASLDERVRELLKQGLLAVAIQDIVAALGPELRGYLRGTLSDDMDGDDVFQEVSIALWERLSTFRFESSIRTFCYAIAHHRVINRLKRYSRRNVMRLSTGHGAELPARSLTSLLEQQRQAHVAAAAAEQLEPTEREILILRAERGLAFADIATILSLNHEASARQRYRRAKERLRELIGRLEADAAAEPVLVLDSKAPAS